MKRRIDVSTADRARAEAVYQMIVNIWPYPACGLAIRLMEYVYGARP